MQQTFFSTVIEISWKKIAKSRFVAPGLGDFGVSYTVHLWLVGKRVVDFILALIELFSVALTVEALRANNLSKLRCLKEGVGHSSVRRVRQKCLLPFVCTAAKQF